MPLQPKDIVEKLLRRHPHWFYGPPTISLVQESVRFATLQFTFATSYIVKKDKVIEYKIYVGGGSWTPEKVMSIAEEAVANFSEIAQEFYYE